MEGKKITTLLVLEILGRPAQHIVDSLKILIEDIGKEKGTKVLNSDVKEAKELEGQPDFFTSFAEIEIESDDFLHLMMIMFKYVPSYIQIMQPETMQVSNANMSEALSELTRRIHEYDEAARILQVQKNQMETQIRSLLAEKEEKPKAKKKVTKKTKEIKK